MEFHGKESLIVHEFTESAPIKSATALHSADGRLCVIAFNFTNLKSKIILAHISEQSIYIQNIFAELKFLYVDEEIKCIDFTYQGNYINK